MAGVLDLASEVSGRVSPHRARGGQPSGPRGPGGQGGGAAGEGRGRVCRMVARVTVVIGRPRKVKRHAAMVARDVEVAALVASGLSVDDIAARLGVSQQTVSESKARTGGTTPEERMARAHRSAPIVKIEIRPTIERSPNNGLDGALTHAVTPQDQTTMTAGPRCPSCGRLEISHVHRSDGPYPPTCNAARA